jgi:hypothetical protein
MCDYSLEAYRSQPAAAGERYVLDRFPSGSKGFTTEPGCMTAVCMMADTKLRLEGISLDVQLSLGVQATEEVTMTRLDLGPYRDAIRFANGEEVLLQRLNPGVTATVLGITSGIEREIAAATAPRELVEV